jgi:hypothetical protein
MIRTSSFFVGWAKKRQEVVNEPLHGSTMRKVLVDLEVAYGVNWTAPLCASMAQEKST